MRRKDSCRPEALAASAEWAGNASVIRLVVSISPSLAANERTHARSGSWRMSKQPVGRECDGDGAVIMLSWIVV